MESGLRKGQLTKWKDERGFGFIQPGDGGKEVFLHISEVKDSTRRPQVGDTIYYRVVTEAGKIRAYNAFIFGARSRPNSPSVVLGNRSAFNGGDKNSFPIWETLLLSILPLIGSLHFVWVTVNPLPLILYIGMNLVTFAVYANDKSRAKRGAWRISERTMHLCELAGGWLGGFIAQRRLRHKSIKSSYQLVFWAIVALHLAFWVDWLFLGGMLLKFFFGTNFRR